MYRIDVNYRGEPEPRETCFIGRATDTFTTIAKLLEQHQGCEAIVLWLNGSRVFSVDGKGERIER